MKKFVKIVSVCVSMLNVAAATCVSEIRYIGCQRIEQETVSSYFPIQVGDICDEDVTNDALKTLKKTNFFTDVKVRQKGSVVTVEVQEAPIINKVSFEGNSKLSDRDIKKAIKLGTHESLSTAKVREIQQGLLETYRKMGRYNATVKPKIIKLKDNRVNLVFEINEGNAAYIDKIVFIGNEKISSSDLRDVMHSKIKRWYRFFVTDDIYDADRLDEDKEVITRYYHEQGYINARVISASAELATNRQSFVLTFTIDEGEQYTFNNVSIKSLVPKVQIKGLGEGLYCRKGDIYKESFVELDTATIARQISKSGFSTVKVTHETTTNQSGKHVDVVFKISEGEKVYISKIVISGNTKTRDNVIRREIPLEEGDAYNQSFVKMAEANLVGLGYFQKVDIQAVPDPSSPDKCVLHVTVEEAPTAEAMASANYSTTDGLGVDLTYKEQNFFGTGKSLSVYLGSSKSVSGRSTIIEESGAKSTTKQKEKFRFLNNVQVAVSDPHVFGKDMEGSVSAHRYTSSRFDGFSTKEIGCDLGLSYALSPHFSQSWEYTIEHRKFQDVSKYASPIIISQVQKIINGEIQNKSDKSVLSSLKHVISYGTHFVRGLKGAFSVSLSTTVAGVGGDAKHLKNELIGTYTMPVFRRSAIGFSLSTGLLTKLGNKEPHLYDSFIMGMDSFRGFEYAGVGPFSSTYREIQVTDQAGTTKTIKQAQNDFIGAKKYWRGTIEYTFPLGLPEELQFRGFVFTDFGTLWDAPNKKTKYLKYKDGDKIKYANIEYDPVEFEFAPANSMIKGHKILDRKKIRQSIGFGISFVTPFGPIKLTYAIPVRKEKYDEQQRFILGFSTSF